MTVCIAAVCLRDEQRRGRLVLCTDWKISGALGSAEIKLKLRAVGLNWRCLTAGSETEINAFTSLLTDRFLVLRKEDEQTVDEGKILSLVRDALAQRKREKIDEIIRGQYALSYEEFMNIGKDKLPADLFREAMLTVRNTVLDVECLVTGFVYGFPIIIRTDGQGRASIHEDFAVVGEGGYLAQTVLLHRAHNDTCSLERTVYTVYEAKKYAEGAASVGEYTTIVVIDSDGNEKRITSEGRKFLSEQYRSLGPQPIPATLKIPDDSFHST